MGSFVRFVVNKYLYRAEIEGSELLEPASAKRKAALASLPNLGGVFCSLKQSGDVQSSMCLTSSEVALATVSCAISGQQ